MQALVEQAVLGISADVVRGERRGERPRRCRPPRPDRLVACWTSSSRGTGCGRRRSRRTRAALLESYNAGASSSGESAVVRTRRARRLAPRLPTGTMVAEGAAPRAGRISRGGATVRSMSTPNRGRRPRLARSRWTSFVASPCPSPVKGQTCRRSLRWLSVNPGQTIGASRAPRSMPVVNSASASQSGVSSGERVPPTDSLHSSS
jgi:hypothetical protein